MSVLFVFGRDSLTCHVRVQRRATQQDVGGFALTFSALTFSALIFSPLTTALSFVPPAAPPMPDYSSCCRVHFESNVSQLPPTLDLTYSAFYHTIMALYEKNLNRSELLLHQPYPRT